MVTDIDGVWTDGAMYYGEDGSEFKRFHVRDGWGAFYLNQLAADVLHEVNPKWFTAEGELRPNRTDY